MRSSGRPGDAPAHIKAASSCAKHPMPGVDEEARETEPVMDPAIGCAPGATRGSIYCISAPGFDKVYVGSTRLKLCQRLRAHLKKLRRWQQRRDHFMSSYEVLVYPGAVIRSLEEGEYADLQHMRAQEAHWINCLPCVNRYAPGRPQTVSQRISRVMRVVCSTCGKSVRTKTIKRHARTRACSRVRALTWPSLERSACTGI
jgi:hypothetical protein